MALDPDPNGPDPESAEPRSAEPQSVEPQSVEPRSVEPEDAPGSAEPRDGDEESRDQEGGDEETLPCGALLALLWEDRAAPPGHDGCPHCAAALDELAALDALVSQTLAAPQPSSPALAQRVMDLVRTELRPGRLVPLGEPDQDDWITETALSRVLRAAAERVPGVAAGSCRITPWSPEPGTHGRSGAAGNGSALGSAPGSALGSGVGSGPGPGSPLPGLPGRRLPRGPLLVALEIVLTGSSPIPDVVRAVRAQVAAAAHDQVGVDLVAVDVTVSDLIDPGPDPDPGPGPDLSPDLDRRRTL